jgi:hypothetical protein
MCEGSGEQRNQDLVVPEERVSLPDAGDGASDDVGLGPILSQEVDVHRRKAL